MTADKQIRITRPACVGMDEAAAIFGWPNYYLPFLVRAGHLKPLGNPAQNARKWFATVQIHLFPYLSHVLRQPRHRSRLAKISAAVVFSGQVRKKVLATKRVDPMAIAGVAAVPGALAMVVAEVR